MPTTHIRHTSHTSIDPSRTTTLRRQFEADIKRRLARIRRAVVHLVVTRDAFGLADTRNPFVFNVQHREFQFQTDPQKLASFRAWLTGQIDAGLLTTDVTGQPWTAKYIDSAYRKGVTRGFTQVRQVELAVESEVFAGSQAEFLRSAFNSPERLGKVELLATRAFEELRGVGAAMAQGLNRELANGIAAGRSPLEIARAMSQSINGLSRRRAELIARTEIIAAHAEGQLDAFADLGVEAVGVLAEWITAGDRRVCARCAARDGELFTLKQARGLIPLHPNCRCAWAPSTPEEREAIAAAAGL